MSVTPTSTSSTRQRDLLERMWPWAKPYARSFALALSLLLFTSLTKMLGPFILQQAVDGYILPGNFKGLVWLVASYIGLALLGFAANYIEILELEKTGQRIIADLKKRAFDHLLSLDLTWFDRSNTGQLVSRIENDANEMKVLFSTVFTHIFGNLLMVLGMFGIMAWQYDLRLAVYVVGLCPVILIAALTFNKWMEPVLINLRKQVAEVNGLLTEVIQGIATIQVFGRQQHFMSEISQRSREKYRMDRRSNTAFNTFFNLLFFIQTLGIVLVLWFGGDMVLRGKMNIGALVMFMSFIRTFFVPIMFLSSQFSEFQKGIAAAGRMFDLLDQQATLKAPEAPANLTAGPYTIEFKNVWFRYSETSDWVLRDLSFICPAGEHWALVGPTGSGKTTIMSLLLRFYDPTQGQILLNGVDIRSLSVDELRSRIGLVLQDVTFFPGTLRSNLTLGAEIPDAKLQRVITEVGLNQLVNRLPEGYETEISEGARNLSEGERQLLSFGRALLRNPDILILDEATSHIDPDTERSLQRAMGTLLEGRTALMIAHRLVTIEQADRILVLRYGELIEQGNHRELMAREGVYAEMRTLQTV